MPPPNAVLSLSLEINRAQAEALRKIGQTIQTLATTHFKEMVKPVVEVVKIQLEKNVKKTLRFEAHSPITIAGRDATGQRKKILAATGEGSDPKSWGSRITRRTASIFNIAKSDKGFRYMQAQASGYRAKVTPKMIAFFALARPTMAFSADMLKQMAGKKGGMPSESTRVNAALAGYRRFPPTKKNTIDVPARNFYVVTSAMQRQAQQAVERFVAKMLRKAVR